MAKKKRKRPSESSAPAPAPTPAEVKESTGTASYQGRRSLGLLLGAVAIVGVGYFVSEGLAQAGKGRGQLAERLLDVKPKAERPIPFNFEKMTGGKLSIEQFQDKVVFVNFWATWCPPCVEEMPSMQRLAHKMKNDPRFVMLAVSADEGWPEVREFFKRPPPFDVLLDAEGKTAKRYGTEKFPETYIVVNGQLVGHIIGPRDWDVWYAEDYLRTLLAEGRHWGS